MAATAQKTAPGMFPRRRFKSKKCSIGHRVEAMTNGGWRVNRLTGYPALSNHPVRLTKMIIPLPTIFFYEIIHYWLKFNLRQLNMVKSGHLFSIKVNV